jgi:hypothetical protein
MAIHRFDILDTLQPDGPINYMNCCEICQTATVTFQNVHNSDLNITDFVIDDTGSGLNITLMAINGSPVSFPFFIAEGDTFTMEIEFCWDGVTDPLGPWTGTIETDEHGADLDWSFEMACVDWSTVWVFPGVPFDFTDTPIGTTNSQSISLNNPTIGPVQFNIDYTGCGTPDPVLVTSPVVLPPLGTGSMTLSWSPTDVSDSISCGPDYCGITLSATGSAIEAPCESCVCCKDIEIQTDGGYLQTQNGFCSVDAIYNTTSFLDKKTIVFKMQYQSPIFSGWQLQFNPNLFADNCAIPFESGQLLPAGYRITYASSLMPDGTVHAMTLNGTGINAMNQRNYDVNFRPVNASTGEFNVELTFFMIQDFENFVTNITFDNSFKLRRNTLSAGTNYDNSFPSVYNSLKIAEGSFVVTDPTILVGDSPFRCGSVACPNITGRFYNKGLNNGPSEFTNPVFTLSRNVGNVTNFSTIENTRVQFSIQVPAIYGAARPTVVFHLFDETLVNNSVDFMMSTDSSRYRVLTYPGTGVLDNHLVRPGILGTSGSNWLFSLHVDTLVNPSSTYRMAAIVYGSDGTMVNTFLSEPITVKRTPDIDCDCTIDVDSGWIQYFQTTLSNCFRPVGKERIGHNLAITPGDFETCLTNWGIEFTDAFESLFLVRLNIYKRRENYPVGGKTTFFIYESHTSVRNNAFPGGFNNGGDLIVAEGAGTILTSINNRRVRWENNLFSGGQVQTAPTNQYMNRTNAGPLGGVYIAATATTDSWINNDVYFEYILTFNLTNYLGTPFFWNIVKAFPVNAIDFEPNNSGYEIRLTDVTFEGMDPVTGVWVAIEPPICFSDWTAIRLTYQAEQEGNFIFFIEPEPYGLAVLQENDELPSPYQMAQLTSDIVISQDNAFDPVTLQASVILDPSKMTNGKYLFCGYISSPEAPAICEYFLFHARIAGSSLFVVLTPQVGAAITGTMNNVTAGRTLVWRSSNGSTVWPQVGENYVFEYSFSVPTTRVLEFRMGELSTGAPLTFTLPIGSTSGVVPFVWGPDTNGFWNIVSGSTGSDMTGTFTFKIGNDLCP